MQLERIELHQAGAFVADAQLTPAALEVLRDLQRRQSEFVRRSYARPGRALSGSPQRLTPHQAIFLRRLAASARRRGTGIPALSAVYVPSWNWLQVNGAVIVRYGPSRDDARRSMSPYVALLCADSAKLNPSHMITIKFPNSPARPLDG